MIIRLWIYGETPYFYRSIHVCSKLMIDRFETNNRVCTPAWVHNHKILKIMNASGIAISKHLLNLCNDFLIIRRTLHYFQFHLMCFCYIANRCVQLSSQPKLPVKNVYLSVNSKQQYVRPINMFGFTHCLFVAKALILARKSEQQNIILKQTPTLS